jgi:hypothetical protein
MTTEEPERSSEHSGQREKSKGELFEGIAFAFCRAATIILIAGKWALPVAAGATAIFYLLAIGHGQKETRCVLRAPLLIALFWGAVCGISLYRMLG